MRDIWMFREPRSGSTSVTKYLADILNRDFCFVDNLVAEIVNGQHTWNNLPNHKLLLNTHLFEKLKELDRYNNPFVFRCTRKNKCEQFLSEVAIYHIGNNFRNIEKDGPTQDVESFYDFTKQQIEIDFKNVVKFMRRKENEDYLWNEYSIPYENYTLYYEDMSFPFDIPALNLYNVTIEHRTEKLPDYKRDVFTNYDQVVEWFSKF